jgi:hypothetical protein
MLGVDGVGDRRCWAILARNFSTENWERKKDRQTERKKKSIQEKKKKNVQERQEMASEQPSSTADIR